jgi:hypothetical protein
MFSAAAATTKGNEYRRRSGREQYCQFAAGWPLPLRDFIDFRLLVPARRT